MAITGSTDGSIGIWDLTECVENFMRQIASLEMENCIEFQKRPRTGRGSQGGRWWRSIDSHKPKKKPGHCKLREKANIHSVSDERAESGNETENHVNGTLMFEQSNDHVPLKVGNQASLVSGRKSDDLPPQTSVLEAMQVLDNIHQSGVNCLFVSDVKRNQRLPDSIFTFYVVSGGDDQAINCLRCDLELDPMMKSQNMNCSTMPEAMNNCNHRFVIQNHHQLQVSYLDKITSAHSSSVKGICCVVSSICHPLFCCPISDLCLYLGIWTDGIWVFSVGLDQRVRCWNLNHDRVTESAHLIISVPEPEALDVKIYGR